MARKPMTTKYRPNASAAGRKELREDVRAFKRKMIVDAAIAIFFRSGYQAATVDDIAAAISVTKAVVYYHFDSKEAVLTAIIERCADLTFAAVERGTSCGETPAEKLALACSHYAKAILDNQEMVGIYFREVRSFSPALRSRVTESERAITSMLARVVEAGIESGDFRPCDTQLFAFTVLGMISMAFYWYTEHGRLSKPELCRRFAADALHLAGYKDERTLEELFGGKFIEA